MEQRPKKLLDLFYKKLQFDYARRPAYNLGELGFVQSGQALTLNGIHGRICRVC